MTRPPVDYPFMTNHVRDKYGNHFIPPLPRKISPLPSEHSSPEIKLEHDSNLSGTSAKDAMTKIPPFVPEPTGETTEVLPENEEEGPGEPAENNDGNAEESSSEEPIRVPPFFRTGMRSVNSYRVDWDLERRELELPAGRTIKFKRRRLTPASKRATTAETEDLQHSPSHTTSLFWKRVSDLLCF